MKVTFLTPTIDAEKVTGGIYCILKYAQGLHERGHDVTVVGYLKSGRPNWIEYGGTLISPPPPRLRFDRMRSLKRSLVQRFDYWTFGRKDPETKRAFNRAMVAASIPDSDVVVATYWETAEIAYQANRGTPAYFMQHFEPIFYEPTDIDHYRSQTSYQLPLAKIANSSWLKGRVSDHLSRLGIAESVHQCTNAVDLDHFQPDPSAKKWSKKPNDVNIISYGGRGVAWKGFQEMAQAVALVRQRLPEYAINWHVYGACELPPDNPIAHYHDLGFLSPQALAKAYNHCDILLSASWYESFPLFPIEAMACGLAVITTAPGTEDYAQHEFNSMIPKEKDPQSIASALERTIVDQELRTTIAANGHATAQKFGWTPSIDRMETVLSEIASQAVANRRPTLS